MKTRKEFVKAVVLTALIASVGAVSWAVAQVWRECRTAHSALYCSMLVTR